MLCRNNHKVLCENLRWPHQLHFGVEWVRGQRLSAGSSSDPCCSSSRNTWVNIYLHMEENFFAATFYFFKNWLETIGSRCYNNQKWRTLKIQPWPSSFYVLVWDVTPKIWNLQQFKIYDMHLSRNPVSDKGELQKYFRSKFWTNMECGFCRPGLPSPQESGKGDIMSCPSCPDRLHPILKKKF